MLAFKETPILPAASYGEDDGTAEQFAVLPWRNVNRFEVLLITSRRSMRWVIPKGWPVPGHTAGETATQEAYEEAGIRGRRSARSIGHYGYRKRLRGQGPRRFRVEVFGMQVTEVLDLWPEVHERKRQWFTPAEAAVHVYAPELAILIRTFSDDQLRQKPRPLNYPLAIRQLKSLLRIA